MAREITVTPTGYSEKFLSLSKVYDTSCSILEYAKELPLTYTSYRLTSLHMEYTCSDNMHVETIACNIAFVHTRYTCCCNVRAQSGLTRGGWVKGYSPLNLLV